MFWIASIAAIFGGMLAVLVAVFPLAFTTDPTPRRVTGSVEVPATGVFGTTPKIWGRSIEGPVTGPDTEAASKDLACTLSGHGRIESRKVWSYDDDLVTHRRAVGGVELEEVGRVRHASGDARLRCDGPGATVLAPLYVSGDPRAPVLARWIGAVAAVILLSFGMVGAIVLRPWKSSRRRG
jgi:hypothetical protein